MTWERLMTDWRDAIAVPGATASPAVLAWRIGCALLLGAVVAGLCRWARRADPPPTAFLTTLVVLSAVIAMATQVIGDNVARAFSLVGALSVVRFRTVVKDTQDAAFVIFAVVVGMAAGANHMQLALVGLAVVASASPILWPASRERPPHPGDAALSIRVNSSSETHIQVDRILTESTERVAPVSVSTLRKGGKGDRLDLAYRLRLLPRISPTNLVLALRALEGVERVDLKTAGRPEKE